MIHEYIHSDIGTYLNNIRNTPFALAPYDADKKAQFKLEKDERNRKFGIIIQKYHSDKKKLSKEIKNLEEKIRIERKSEIPIDFFKKIFQKNKIEQIKKRLDKNKKEYVNAKQGLSQSCLYLVINIAKHYSRKFGIDIDELIGYGNTGLMRSTDKYNPDHKEEGIKFTTYATYWIRQSIYRGVHELKTRKNLPVPNQICGVKKRIIELENKMFSELEREPTEKELCDRYNLKYASENYRKRIKEQHIKAMRDSKRFSSLIIKEEYDDDLERDIQDKSCKNPAEEASKNETINAIMNYMDNLSFNESEVIKYRLGLEDRTSLTLAEIGKKLGLTRERIRQIEARAMLKLKYHFN